MAISDYQMRAVIRTYMKTMKGRITDSARYNDLPSDRDGETNISSYAVKKMMADRAEKQITDRLKKNGPQR